MPTFSVVFLAGMVLIVTPRLILKRYVSTAKSPIMVHGIGKIVHAIYENRKNVH